MLPNFGAWAVEILARVEERGLLVATGLPDSKGNGRRPTPFRMLSPLSVVVNSSWAVPTSWVRAETRSAQPAS